MCSVVEQGWQGWRGPEGRDPGSAPGMAWAKTFPPSSELVGKQEQPPEGAKTQSFPNLKSIIQDFGCSCGPSVTFSDATLRPLGAAKAKDVKFPPEG